ncbi:gamma-glutamyltransferase family protein [Amycolatopsis acidicola]|uniref:Gamma-glutamyltransferase family protein n=2 Tax=Amycolatopsis acidicola TaxID=2596893 RepID=A0A5N0VCG7_9PSEU|nr:gamma-glutamyltransferase family protein [Amycolatopsis acidicola]
MVASTHWLASSAGYGVLAAGGNAFDAAVTSGFVLQIVEPHLNGPGGEVPILFMKPGGRAQVLCGQGVAPAAATVEAFDGYERVPGLGVRSACVPGAFDAWMRLLLDHGRLSLRQVLEPAIDCAHNGFPIVPKIASTIESVEQRFRQEWLSSAEVWLPKTGAGQLHRCPQIAETYRRLRGEAEACSSDRDGQIEHARRIWSQGFVAEHIDQFLRTEVPDGSGGVSTGLLTGQDMAGWSAEYEDTASVEYGGYTVHKPGAWSQGPVFLQQLQLAKHTGLAELTDSNSAEFVHLITEAAKLAFADREAWYADPRFADVPLDELLSDRYAKERAALITDVASLDLRPGTVSGRTPYLPPQATVPVGTVPVERGNGEPTVSRGGEPRGDTCHVDVVDREGNMVAATPSGAWLSSSPVVPGLGFPIGTRAQMFWLDPRSPNCIAPGKRPRTTLSPGLISRGAEPVLAFGTPGGDQQDQWTFSFLQRWLHHDIDLQEAIDAPNFHNNSFPSSFYPREIAPGQLVVESRFGAEVVRALENRGHRVVRSEPWSLGRISAVARDAESGLLSAAANPRGRQGYAVGR